MQTFLQATKSPLEPNKAFLLSLRHAGFKTPCTSGVIKLLHIDVHHMHFYSPGAWARQRGGDKEN